VIVCRGLDVVRPAVEIDVNLATRDERFVGRWRDRRLGRLLRL